MKTKQEQFNEMILNSCDIKENPNCEECLFSVVCDVKEICEKLYSEGYRKAKDVINEFVEKFRDLLIDKVPKDYKENYEHYNYPIDTIEMFILKVSTEIRQEIEK